ncbi:MAG: OB-fold putative lipoprotein [Bacteroidales bacterium]|nr:OB-fold putative lipoprotein [Bacteroidales bacterium]
MSKWLKIIIILAIIGVLAGLGVYFFLYNKPHPDYAEEKPEYKLEAQELFEAFTGNRKQAEKKYNGKIIQISGTPDKVQKTDSLTIVVFAFEQGMFGNEGVRCTMLPAYVEASKNVAGQNTVIKGYCSGYNDSDVILEHCSLPENQ